MAYARRGGRLLLGGQNGHDDHVKLDDLFRFRWLGDVASQAFITDRSQPVTASIEKLPCVAY